MVVRLPSPREKMSDVLERVLTRGVLFDVDKSPATAEEARDAVVWFRVSIAGVDVFRIEAGLSWQSWREAEDNEE